MNDAHYLDNYYQNIFTLTRIDYDWYFFFWFKYFLTLYTDFSYR